MSSRLWRHALPKFNLRLISLEERNWNSRVLKIKSLNFVNQDPELVAE
jgi:hypothetical protein